MSMTRVRVRRERPGALAWAVALAATMLAVYLLTLPAKRKSDSLFASATVTRALSLEAVDAWCVSLGRRDTPEAARALAATLADRGAAGVAAELDGAWQALGAAYDDRREAERVAGRIRAEAGLDAAAVRLYAPAVNLRVTAPEAQLDDVAAADALLRGQAAQLGTLARQLDRGETTAEAVRALCAVAASQVRERARSLRRWPERDEDRLCAPLAGLLETLSGLLDGPVSAGSATTAALSGLLRAARLETLLRLAAWQGSLG